MSKKYSINGKKIPGTDIKAIGQEDASLYGGSCYDISVDGKKKEVVFICIEHDEEFAMVMSFDELEKRLQQGY